MLDLALSITRFSDCTPSPGSISNFNVDPPFCADSCLFKHRGNVPAYIVAVGAPFGAARESAMSTNVKNSPCPARRRDRPVRLSHPLAMLSIALLAASPAWTGDPAAKSAAAVEKHAVLWTAPQDIAGRDLFYGPGGQQGQPRPPFQFVKEEREGTNPKFVVSDANGVKWKAKLGLEAASETAASRIVWGIGYYASEDYFLREMKVAGMPAHLHRGDNLVGPAGTVHNVRLKREPEGDKKVGQWRWNGSAVTGAREWNGLRVLMAVINNWDLKDMNNAVYRRDKEDIFMVSDLGATFGSAGLKWPLNRSRNNIDSYAKSKFIRRVHRDTVDFQTPARPAIVFLVAPKQYFGRIRMERLGRDIPRADAKWLGELLAKLSPAQIRDAFRAGGYSPQEIDAFSRILTSRIAALGDL